MAANTSPIFPVAPVLAVASLTSPTPVTSRANITGTTGLTNLIGTTTEGVRIDTIRVKGKATVSATNLFIWVYNGTTSFLYDEIVVNADTAGNTDDSFSYEKSYSNLVLPATYSLYVSVTVAAELNIYAAGGIY